MAAKARACAVSGESVKSRGRARRAYTRGIVGEKAL
jgi:hypothetical protein